MIVTAIHDFLFFPAVEVMSTGLELDSFLRVASISVAGYDFLITLPVEWRIYRSSDKLKFRWSVSRVLFILIRYISLVLLVISNVGYFHHGFSAKACERYYMVAPALKVIQMIVSQVIIGYRTWNIAQRSRYMGLFLLAFGFVVTALGWYANFDSRMMVQVNGNCSPGNEKARVPQWLFYLLAIFFDVITIVLSSCFLIKSASGINTMTSTLKMLLYDGLGYIVVLTAANVMNLILYQHSVEDHIQSSGASFGYMVVWIMSQSILIHIHEVAEARAQRGLIFGRGVAQNARSHKCHDSNGRPSLDVQVQIERAVMVDYDPKVSRKPQVLNWEGKQSGTINRDGSPTDQAQWELSGIAKTAGVV